MAVANSSRKWRAYHEKYALCTILNASGGGAEIYYRRALLPSTVGRTFLIEPGETHVTRRITGAGSFRVMFIEADMMETIAAELSLRATHPHFRQADVPDGRLAIALRRFHRAVEGSTSALEQQILLTNCLRHILVHYAEERASEVHEDSRRAVERIREYLHGSWADDLQLRDLAQVSGISQFHLCRSFSAAFGLPPHAYLMHLRVVHAKKLLRLGISPADVAARVGFCDQSHLVRWFRSVYGVTPARYARL
jgi:AraC-like DNA-binding protein